MTLGNEKVRDENALVHHDLRSLRPSNAKNLFLLLFMFWFANVFLSPPRSSVMKQQMSAWLQKKSDFRVWSNADQKNGESR